MSGYILLTGATGLVGRYLIRDLLKEGHKLAVIVRPSRKLSCAERIESIMQMWEKQLDTSLPRPVCLSGDITKPLFGLDETDQYWVAQNCDRLLHSAAILQFYGSDRNAEPWRSNLDGTKHALQLCRETGIRDFHYISTAYVCGKRPGRIMESELNEGQEFRNDYEHSKMLAEQEVRNADYLDHITVYRPAVVAGDSITGYTNTYHGIYMYLKLMSVLVKTVEPDSNGVRHTPVHLPMNGDEPRNIIPVDWVSAIITRLIDMPEALDKTFHLAPEKGLTAREVIDAGYTYFNSDGVVFANETGTKDAQADFLTQEVLANSQIYQSYALTDPVFDMTNTNALITDLPCPVIDEPMLHRFIQYGEEDRWGKRPVHKPIANVWLSDLFQNEDLVSELQIFLSEEAWLENGISNHAVIGLDFTGPGGGQCSLLLQSNQPSLLAGLPIDESTVIRISMQELTRFADAFELQPAMEMNYDLVGVSTLQTVNISRLLEIIAKHLLPSETVTKS